MQEQIYARLPQVKALDLEIRQTMADVMAHTFRHGGDPQAAVKRIREKNLDLQQQRNHLLQTAGYRPERSAKGPDAASAPTPAMWGNRCVPA